VIGLIDYGMGNRRSVEKALERVGAEAALTGDLDVLRDADGLILPGVGAFPEAMRRLRDRGLDELVRERAAAGVPVLGICLGMQLLFEHSAEHEGADGLGLIAGHVDRLRPEPGAKLPHIGWNLVTWRRPSPLVAGLGEAAAFYHVHSFVVRPADADVVVGTGRYGETFASVVARDSVFGAQFHPEKSSRDGLALLRAFTEICLPVAAS
jgi:glutamine amidotransferase